MAVARDVLTQNTAGAASFTHTPVGTPRGITVLIVSTAATDTVTGVTYGGTAMSQPEGSPVVSTSAEGGACHAFTLGESGETVPTGAQTVAITGTGTLRVIVQSATAGNHCDFVVGTFEQLAVSGDQTVTLATGGRESAVTIVAWSEAGTVGGVNPLANWTAAAGGEADEGSESTYRYSFDTVGTSDVSAGVNVPSSAGLAFIVVAIVEAAGGGAINVDVDPASETETAISIGHSKNRTIGVGAETETAVSIGHSKSRALGVASETETAQAIGHSKSRALGTALEVETAVRFLIPQFVTLGVAVETETAGAIAASTEGVTPPEEEPSEPPRPPFTGGFGGFARRELTDEQREALLRRVRKSLGMDKEEPAPDAGEPVSEPAAYIPLAEVIAGAVQAPYDEEDDEIAIMLAA
jgi:hypothetical protein